MKNVIKLFVLIFLVSTVGYAQITKPKINVKINSKELKKEKLHRGLDISKLKKLTLDDLKKLKVPVASYSNTKLLTRARSTWKITPTKPFDRNLKLALLRGSFMSGQWNASSFLTCDFSSDYYQSYINSARDGTYSAMRSIAAFGVTFNAVAGKEYRVKINLHPYTGSRNSYYIGTHSEMLEVFINGRKDLNYIFYASESGWVELFCTGRIDRSGGQITNLDHLPIQYFQVEELNQ